MVGAVAWIEYDVMTVRTNGADYLSTNSGCPTFHPTSKALPSRDRPGGDPRPPSHPGGGRECYYPSRATGGGRSRRQLQAETRGRRFVSLQTNTCDVDDQKSKQTPNHNHCPYQHFSRMLNVIHAQQKKDAIILSTNKQEVDMAASSTNTENCTGQTDERCTHKEQNDAVRITYTN